MACAFAAPQCSLLHGSQSSTRRPFMSVTQRSTASKSVRLQRSRRNLVVNLQKVPGKEDDELGSKKQLTRESEPEEFWQTAAEAKGQNPIKDPMAIVGILGLLSPFVILGVAIAMGAVDVSAYRGR